MKQRTKNVDEVNYNFTTLYVFHWGSVHLRWLSGEKNKDTELMMEYEFKLNSSFPFTKFKFSFFYSRDALKKLFGEGHEWESLDTIFKNVVQ